MSDEVQADGVQEEAVESKSFGEAEVQEMIKKAVEDSTGRLNSEFQKKFAEIKKEKEEAVKGKLSFEEENRKMIEQMRQERDRERWIAKSIKAYSEAGLPVPDDDVIADMVRLESEDPLRIVQYDIKRASELMQQTELKTKDEFVKRHGRKVVDPDKPEYKTIQDYTDDEIKKMSDTEFNKIMERSKKE